MKASSFIRAFCDIKINGPKYSNKMPPEQKDAVNICNIPYGLRDYYIESVYYDDATIAILWVAEEWDQDVFSLVNEITRYYEYLAKVHNLEADILLEITIGNKDIQNAPKYFDRVICKNGG